MPGFFQQPPGLLEQRIHGVEAANLKVNFDAFASSRQASGGLRPDAGLREDREGRNHRWVRRGEPERVVIQEAKHSRPVRVGQGGVITHAQSIQDEFPDSFGVPVRHRPRRCQPVEPSPHRILNVGGQEVDVRIDNAGETQRSGEAGNIVVSHRQAG